MACLQWSGPLVALIVSSASGQVFLLDIPIPPTSFPVARGAGDLDRDGFADVLVAGNDPSTSTWTARAVSGKTGLTLFTWTGTLGVVGYEVHVEPAGDSDSDGYPDVLIGNLSASNFTGELFVYSGRDGRLLRSFGGSSGVGGGIGAGDFDSDGHADVVTSDYAWLNQVQNWQIAVAYSGRTGSVLYRVVSPSPPVGPIGRSLAVLRDVDGDNVPDFVAGGAALNAYVFSGATGLPLFQVPGYGSPVGGFPGVASAGDVDGDGRGDVLVYPGTNANPPGRVLVYSGRSGLLRHTIVGPSQYFGNALDGAGDVDGDGYDDIVIGNYTANGFWGAVSVYSGRNAQLLLELDGSPFSSQFGRWVSGAGDVDSDGTPDFLGVSVNNVAHVFSFSEDVIVFDSASGNKQGFEGLVRQRLGLLDASGKPLVDGSGALLPLVSTDRRRRAYDLAGQASPQLAEVLATANPRNATVTILGHGGNGAIEVDGFFVRGFGTGTGNTCNTIAPEQLDTSGAKASLAVNLVVCKALAQEGSTAVSVASSLAAEIVSVGGSVRSMTASRELVSINLVKNYVPLVTLSQAQVAAADAIVRAFAPIGLRFQDEYTQFQAALDVAVGGAGRVRATLRYYADVGGTRIEAHIGAEYSASTCRGCGFLTIEASPNPVAPGQTVLLNTRDGDVGSPAVLLATRIGGASIAPLTIAVGIFGSSSTWQVPLPVPVGVQGYVDFQTVSVAGGSLSLLLSDDVRVLVR